MFLFASVTPVYFVWLTPELFNFTLVFSRVLSLGLQAGCPAGGAGPRGSNGSCARRVRTTRRLVLLGIATFSKPTHILLTLPIGATALFAREWRRLALMIVCFSVVVVGSVRAERDHDRRSQLSGRRSQDLLRRDHGLSVRQHVGDVRQSWRVGRDRCGAFRHPAASRHRAGPRLEPVVLHGGPIQRPSAVFLPGPGRRGLVRRAPERAQVLAVVGCRRARLWCRGAHVLHAVHLLRRRRSRRQPLLRQLLSAVPLSDAARFEAPGRS